MPRLLFSSKHNNSTPILINGWKKNRQGAAVNSFEEAKHPSETRIITKKEWGKKQDEKRTKTGKKLKKNASSSAKSSLPFITQLRVRTTGSRFIVEASWHGPRAHNHTYNLRVLSFYEFVNPSSIIIAIIVTQVSFEKMRISRYT